jgi:NADPH:quinone reductase-like Zn-dependent oxidoreductase
MRAWVRRTRGPARSALELTTSMATPAVPTSSSTDVLIRVSHVPLQYSSGLTLQVLPRLPFTGAWVPELELSGEVVAAGNGAPAEVREPGTSVIAFQNVPGVILRGDGVLAEYVRLPGCQVVRIDPAVDMASASGIIGSGCTAIKMIRTAGIREGHRVLVNGASGSVGQVVSQMSKLRGATVVGVASGGNEAIVRNTGVDEVGRVDQRATNEAKADDRTTHSSSTTACTTRSQRTWRSNTATNHLTSFLTASAHRHFSSTRQLTSNRTAP